MCNWHSKVQVGFVILKLLLAGNCPNELNGTNTNAEN
jgi:hypothetical protein